ncbi:MAG: hypothetical protein ING90_08595 [Rhodocyclaceae bacterium]|nr:hypothetical protein [Rhodocyclaceae bacterium]MCA3074190.1 hypothetical protein [Rhodocyclaceae bacterium]MCA3095089.1 hypothetical protein [Rhodocyclaceae bacterium]MCA3099432.1 hypothetical protein [Rhodocyclaceae bacterium]MCA3102819.1 hypothetical protein [Rhodocyclaceae bacterium]
MGMTISAPFRVGFSLTEWCELTSISRPKLYTLPAELRPKTIKIGRRTIVIEAPADYLKRVAATQEKKR